MTETIIPGNDYSIISNKGFEEFFPAFVDELKASNPQLVVEEVERIEEEVYEYFIANDTQTHDDYEEHGYASNARGEGCFTILARRVNNLEYKMEVMNKAEEEVEETIDPYPAVLILHDTWNYTLVLPAAVENSAYSQQVYDKAIKALK
ncbi:hypothetical protein [Chitinophaga rhizophila]|uniref:Uncharacterized protein n=1 Tax=Chitinophaga rhizophila TaxID=2866212 RepID=A0ABS7GCR1_9BACT|nr:hypothetical protein [Chitinophaga rhizophila]MBW8685459.1 hypothetical protein [Chitinophaga rhizophila]